MSTFVVIGARGGVGQQLVHRLLARDASLVAKVIAVVRDPSALTTAVLLVCLHLGLKINGRVTGSFITWGLK